MKERKKYTKEFKEQTVKSVVEGKRKVSEIARDLDISENVIHRWKSEHLKHNVTAFPGKGKLRPELERLRQLEKENRDLKEERDILKKAMAIFSKL